MGKFLIQVKDFQSLVKAEIVLEDGLNIIVGKTNAGKSAVIRAIDSALFNIGNDEMVKVGNRYAHVLIDNDRHNMLWRRDTHGKNEKTMYQFDGGVAQTKVGRGQLEEVGRLFNITDVRLANGIKEKINFWYQGEKPFLTDKTAGQLFEFFSQSSCEKYIKVIKKLEQDKKSQRAEIESTTNTIDILKSMNAEKQTYLDSSVGFDELYKEIVLVNHESQEFEKTQELLSRFEALKARIFVKSVELQKMQDRLTIYNFENISEVYKSLDDLSSLVSIMTEYIMDIKKKRESRKLVGETLSSLLLLHSKKEKAFNACEGEVQELFGLEVSVNSLKALVDAYNIKQDKQKSVLNALSSLQVTIDSFDLNSFGDIIQKLENESIFLNELGSLVSSLESKQKVRISKDKEYQTLCEEYQKAYKGFEDFKTSIGTCPYCNNSFSGEHTH
jgi:hypothetical protein